MQKHKKQAKRERGKSENNVQTEKLRSTGTTARSPKAAAAAPTKRLLSAFVKQGLGLPATVSGREAPLLDALHATKAHTYMRTIFYYASFI